MMVEPVAESLFEHLISAFPPNRAYTRAAFARHPMPSGVSHYLGQQLQERLEEELDHLRSVRSEAFDYDHPDVHRAHQAFVAVLAQHAQIPPPEWEATLRQAVQQVVRFLVRPTHVLTEHVFPAGAGKQLAAHDVFRRIGYFEAYPYLRDVVEAYFEQRNLQEIDRARFAALLGRIDRQMTDDYDTDDWIRLLEPLFSLMRMLPGMPEGVPAPLLHAFFEEKEATHLAARFHDGQEPVDEAALRRLLQEASAARRVAPPEQPATPQRPRQPAPPAEEKEPPGAVPLWKRFQQGPMHDTPETMPAPGPRYARREHVTPETTPPADDDGALPLWKRFHTHPQGSTNDAPAELDAVERAVLGDRGVRNREHFVDTLFAGSVDEYLRTLQRLRTAPSWNQASQIIAQEVFIRHKVNIYSEPAVAFTDAVEAQFRQ